MVPLNIMVVDDSLLVTRKLETMITEMGHKMVRSVGSGAMAVNVYAECNPDLVTMDITMPDVDGIQATRNIIARFPDATIVMVTSHGQEAMVREAIKAGAKGYLLKPVRPEKFADHLTMAIRRRKLRTGI